MIKRGRSNQCPFLQDIIMKQNKENTSKEPFDLLAQGCERPWEVAVKPFQVAPHTWYVGNSWVGAYLIDTSDGLILIDATMQPQVYLLFESIRTLGFSPDDIKLVLLSHAHYDHGGGIRAVLEASGAKLYMSKEDSVFISKRPEMMLTENYPCGEFEADFFYSDEEPIILGNIEIATVHTPGHTPGTTSFFFNAADDNGNTYRCEMHGGVGVNTLTDEFLTDHKLPLSSRHDYLNSLMKVRDFYVDITLGSHPGQVDMLDKVDKITDRFNPFLDSAVWQDLIDKRIAMISEILDNTEIQG